MKAVQGALIRTASLACSHSDTQWNSASNRVSVSFDDNPAGMLKLNSHDQASQQFGNGQAHTIVLRGEAAGKVGACKAVRGRGHALQAARVPWRLKPM